MLTLENLQLKKVTKTSHETFTYETFTHNSRQDLAVAFAELALGRALLTKLVTQLPRL